MPIESKVSLMNKMEKTISPLVTAESLNKMMVALSDVLQWFEVSEIPNGEELNYDLLDCYLNALKVEGKSPLTLQRYEYEVRRMMKFVKVPTRQITVYHIRGYLSAEENRGISKETLRGLRDVFNAYFGWLHREGLIERDPMSNISVIKTQKKQKIIYTPVDIEKLNENCSELRYPLRNRAIIAFLKSTGCRISEATGLDRDAVDLNSLEVIVLGKGNKQRKVYIDDVTGMLMKQYLDSRTDDNPALFVNQRGGRLKPGGVRNMLKCLAQHAGVEHVHPHKFRRTLATNLNRRGMPIQEVAHILGHEKLDTTMKYVILNDDDLKNDYRKFTL